MGKIVVLAVTITVTVTVAVLAPDASAQAPAPAPPATHQTRVFSALKVVTCVFAVGAFVAGNTALILKARRLGGVVKVAKKLWKAKNAEKRAQLIFAAFGSLSGATGLISTCAP